jgi:hypothetical protein
LSGIIRNILPSVEGVMVDYHTGKNQSMVIYHNTLH